MGKSLEILLDPQTAIAEAARKVDNSYSGDTNKVADLYVRLAHAQAELKEENQSEIRNLIAVAESSAFSLTERTAAKQKVSELLGLQ